MDHNHHTGEFCAWACRPCNRRINDRIGPLGEPAYYGERKTTPLTYRCENCGDTFTATRAARFCSRLCRERPAPVMGH